MTSYVCKDCKMRFPSERRLDTHRARAHPRKRRTARDPGGYWQDSVGAGL